MPAVQKALTVAVHIFSDLNQSGIACLPIFLDQSKILVMEPDR